jgi:hypothetical protein
VRVKRGNVPLSELSVEQRGAQRFQLASPAKAGDPAFQRRL